MNQAVADFALLTLENQAVLRDLVGPADCAADLARCSLTLGREFRIALLGSWAERTDTFLWGWANGGLGLGADHPVNAPVAALRERADGLGMPELAADQAFPVAGINDLGWLPAAGLASVACGLLGAHGLCSAPYAGGRAWFVLLDAPPVQPNPVKLARLSTMAFEAAWASPQDVGVRHRQTLALYASRRGLGPRDRADGDLDLVYPHGSLISCTFDDAGRLTHLEATLRGDDVPPPLPFEGQED